MQQRHLEVQLSEAKLARHTVVAAEEKELSLQERQQVREIFSNHRNIFSKISTDSKIEKKIFSVVERESGAAAEV